MKNFGGREAKRQLKESLCTFNDTKVTPILKSLSVRARDWKKYHCIPKDDYEETSGDKQVVLKLTNHADAEKALKEIERCRLDGAQQPVGILDESDLAVQQDRTEHV